MLATACRAGEAALAQQLLDGLPPLDVLNALESRDGGTPLHWACYRSLDSIALRLVAAPNVDIDARFGVDGTSPLWQSCNRRLSTVALALLSTGRVDVRVRDSWDSTTPLWQAAKSGLEEVVLRLLDCDGIEPDVADVMVGVTPLWWVSYNGLPDAALRLLSLGVDVNAQHSSMGTTPFYWACAKSLLCVAIALIETDCDVGAQREDGTTPLWHACGDPRLEDVALRILAAQITTAQGEAIIDLVDVNSGTTPLLRACANGLPKAALRLLELGADANAVDVGGCSALRWACQGGDKAVALRLRECGCLDDVLCGQTALRKGTGRERTARCVELLQHGREGRGDAVIDTLVAIGAAPERLLLAAATLGSAPLARRCLFHGARGTAPVDGDGRVARAVGAQAVDAIDASFFAQLGAFLGRYVLEDVPPVHRSASCLVIIARDVNAAAAVGVNGGKHTSPLDATTGNAVALKLMAHRKEMSREITTRAAIGHSAVVVRVLGWHTPADAAAIDGTASDGTLGQRAAPTRTTRRSEEVNGDGDDHAALRAFPYALVMERGGQSLFIENVTQRIAGVDANAVARLFRDIATRVASLHALGFVHGDLKLRNVIRRRDASKAICLCDLDAALPLGSVRSSELKLSTAYAAPELQASLRMEGMRPPCSSASGGLIATAALDVWSLGVVLFELCTGRTLFAQDISNDDMVEESDQMRLATWCCVADDALAAIFHDPRLGSLCSATQRDDVQHLIRWMLAGDPLDRPSLDEILSHRFVGGATPPPLATQVSLPSTAGALLPPITARDSFRPRYHIFLSHSQAEASGDAGTLYHLLEQIGVRAWRDMNQTDLTERGLRQGVYDSDVFILFLTNSVLSRPYCLLELGWAIEFNKPIVVIVETEPRFWPFDLERWKRDECAKLATSKWTVDYTLAVPFVDVPTHICEFVEEQWVSGTMLPFRRREWETDALVREIVRQASRNTGVAWGQCLPTQGGTSRVSKARANATPDSELVGSTSGGDGNAAALRAPASVVSGQSWVVCIGAESSALNDSIAAELQVSFESAAPATAWCSDITWCSDAITADTTHAVVLLTRGSVDEGSRCTSLIEAAAACDVPLSFIYLKWDAQLRSRGENIACAWDFDQLQARTPTSATRAVQASEALAYRHAANGGVGRYEHDAMVMELIARMSCAGGTGAGGSSSALPPQPPG